MVLGHLLHVSCTPLALIDFFVLLLYGKYIFRFGAPGFLFIYISFLPSMKHKIFLNIFFILTLAAKLLMYCLNDKDKVNAQHLLNILMTRCIFFLFFSFHFSHPVLVLTFLEARCGQFIFCHCSFANYF